MSEKSDTIKKWLGRALWIVPSVYALNFAYALYSNQEGGTFGDTFGAANALFSGFALLMLVLAVVLQRDELAIVKEERDDTRKILEGQEEINLLQKDAIEKQILDQGFFSICRLIQERSDSLDLKIAHGVASLTDNADSQASVALKEFPKITDEKLDLSMLRSTSIGKLPEACLQHRGLILLMQSAAELSAPLCDKFNIYDNTLRTFIDMRTARIWCALLCRELMFDQRASGLSVGTFRRLAVTQWIDEETRDKVHTFLVAIQKHQ